MGDAEHPEEEYVAADPPPPLQACEDDHNSDLAKIASGSSVNFAGSIARTFLLFLYAAFLAAFLNPAEVGLYFLGLTLMTLLGTASLVGLDTGVLRFTSLFRGEGDHARIRGIVLGAVAVALPFSAAVGLLLFFLSDSVATGIFSKPDLAPVLKVFATAIPLFVIAKVFNSATQGLCFMRYQVYSRDIGEQLIKFVATAALLMAGYGLAWVAGANVIALLGALLLSFGFLFKVEPLFGTGKNRITEQRRLLSYSGPLALSTLLSLLLLWTDTLLLGYFRSSEEVGIYSVAMRLAVVGAVILISFNTIFAPLASDLFNRREQERLQRLVKSVTRWILVLSLPTFLCLALFAEQALRLMGGEYRAGGSVLVILAMGQLINAAAGPVVFLLLMSGRPRVVLVNNVVCFLIDVVLCYVLIPRFGMEGAAVAFAITLGLQNLFALAGVIFVLKLQPFSRGYIHVGAAGASAAVIALGFQHLLPSPINLVLSFGAFALTYLLLLYLGALERSDLLVINMLRAKVVGARAK